MKVYLSNMKVYLSNFTVEVEKIPETLKTRI